MKIVSFFFIFILITNCSLNKVVKHHGVHFLEKKQEKLILNSTNRNDVLSLLGPPSTESTFDNDLWIYIERKTTTSQITSLGRKRILSNNVLLLEIDNTGILVRKEFLDMNNMNTLKISKNETDVINRKNSFVRDFLSSLRQKINDPLGKRKIK